MSNSSGWVMLKIPPINANGKQLFLNHAQVRFSFMSSPDTFKRWPSDCCKNQIYEDFAKGKIPHVPAQTKQGRYSWSQLLNMLQLADNFWGWFTNYSMALD